MKYLLDVNALLAWRSSRSVHHEPFHAWVARVGVGQLTTCALVELGFLRISMQVFGYTRAQADAALAAMKGHGLGFVSDAPSPQLAAWATTPRRTTDAYLVQVAKANGLQLATFDAGIPAAFVIR